jgi:transposase
MKDTELYTRLLGIRRPWYVKEVQFSDSPERIDVYVDHESGIELPCPECDDYCPVYDHLAEREWQHLHTCHVPTYIHARLPRIKCKQHGVRSVISEWSEPGSDLTRALECHLIDLEKECSVEAVSRLSGLSWDRCWGVIERAVKRGQTRKQRRVPAHIGVDEKSFAKHHKYETIVCDLEKSTVEYVGDDRKQESLEAYFQMFTQEELETIESISMDMWEHFVSAAKAYVPDADTKIVFDKFHVMSCLNKATDQVRRQEHKELQNQNNEVLKGTKYWWLYNPDNIPQFLRPAFDSLRKMDLKVSRAWAIKENFRRLWNYHREGWALRFFKSWYFWATHSRLEPIIKAAKTIKNHLSNVLTYLRHRITNAIPEALNAQIEKVKRMAQGYRNREHYRTAIYFHCGGLDLYPRLVTTTSGGHPQ